MTLTTSVMLRSAFVELPSGHSIKKRDPSRQEGAAAEKQCRSRPRFDAKPLVAWRNDAMSLAGKCKRERSNTFSMPGRGGVLHDQGRFEMSELSDSYVLRVLLATHTPTRAVDAVARRWRWLRASMCDPYRPELHYMRGPGPKWRAKHARGAGW
jgi:hypothetical protein